MVQIMRLMGRLWVQKIEFLSEQGDGGLARYKTMKSKFEFFQTVGSASSVLLSRLRKSGILFSSCW